MKTRGKYKKSKKYKQRELVDLTGKKFGKLAVLGDAEPNLSKEGGKRRMTHFQCECGKEVTRLLSSVTAAVKNDKTPDCGCTRGWWGIKHGMSATTTYHIWSGIVRRGTGKEHQKHYADRGIAVCDRWLKFENFLEDMGPRPHPKMSIERVDNDKNYEPSNCVWATQAEQVRNTRQSRFVEYQGKNLCVTDLAKELGLDRRTVNARLNKYGMDGIDKPLSARPVVVGGVSMELKTAALNAGLGYSLVQNRLRLGWTLEDALNTPVMPKTFRYKPKINSPASNS